MVRSPATSLRHAFRLKMARTSRAASTSERADSPANRSRTARTKAFPSRKLRRLGQERKVRRKIKWSRVSALTLTFHILGRKAGVRISDARFVLNIAPDFICATAAQSRYPDPRLPAPTNKSPANCGHAPGSGV